MHDFTFIDNSGITVDHLQNDGVHLADGGSSVLLENYLHNLNSLYWDNIIVGNC